MRILFLNRDKQILPLDVDMLLRDVSMSIIYIHGFSNLGLRLINSGKVISSIFFLLHSFIG